MDPQYYYSTANALLNVLKELEGATYPYVSNCVLSSKIKAVV